MPKIIISKTGINMIINCISMKIFGNQTNTSKHKLWVSFYFLNKHIYACIDLQNRHEPQFIKYKLSQAMLNSYYMK